ncbi:hypothetical protein HK104_010384 [Borealophlyctis nickersoniae]|nr:hypothetical protein HK104_010384 [Borealophlyctis nickersoniae]
MSSYADLKEALRETLAAKGTLADLQSRMRAEVFRALEDEGVLKPEPPKETRLVNELIREYLEFNGYMHAASVFKAESGLPRTPTDRVTLAKELNVTVDIKKYPEKVPLLYGLALRDMGSERKLPASREQRSRAEGFVGWEETERERGNKDVGRSRSLFGQDSEPKMFHMKT